MADHAKEKARKSNVTKRVRYFDGQFLESRDFIDEQNYHISRNALANRLLRVAGICEGLQIECSSTDKDKLIVKPGVALSDAGEFIVVDEELSVKEESNNAPSDQNDQKEEQTENEYELWIYLEKKLEGDEFDQFNNDFSTLNADSNKGAIRWKEKVDAIGKRKKDSTQNQRQINIAMIHIKKGPIKIKSIELKSIEYVYSGIQLGETDALGNRTENQIYFDRVANVLTLEGDIKIKGELTVEKISIANPNIIRKTHTIDEGILKTEISWEGKINQQYPILILPNQRILINKDNAKNHLICLTVYTENSSLNKWISAEIPTNEGTWEWDSVFNEKLWKTEYEGTQEVILQIKELCDKKQTNKWQDIMKIVNRSNQSLFWPQYKSGKNEKIVLDEYKLEFENHSPYQLNVNDEILLTGYQLIRPTMVKEDNSCIYKIELSYKKNSSSTISTTNLIWKSKSDPNTIEISNNNRWNRIGILSILEK